MAAPSGSTARKALCAIRAPPLRLPCAQAPLWLKLADLTFLANGLGFFSAFGTRTDSDTY